MVGKMTFMSPYESQSTVTQDHPECTRLYWDSTYQDRITLDQLEIISDDDLSYDGTMKAARERYPHVLPLFALWEYISEEWVLDSWTKQHGEQKTVANVAIEGFNEIPSQQGVWGFRRLELAPESLAAYLKLPIGLTALASISPIYKCVNRSDIESKLLYGQNTLEFTTGNPNCGDNPAGLIAERGIKYYPCLRQPTYDPMNTRRWVRSVNKAFSCIKTQSNLKEFPAWAWCDPFIRFLFTIEPDNSAELQRLNFSGQVKSHSSIRYPAGHEDLIQSMRIYIHIINILCPKVWKVTLVAWGEDDILGGENDEKHLTTVEKFLAMFLETEFRDLRCQGRMHSFCDPIATERGTLAFAKPTIDWFVKRARILDNSYQHSMGIDCMRLISS
ncbi:hypothetical protein EAE96_007845 [Botrytis aclada]|nr:hypothetical protein EAE96_007845 [Botrytis aclada]